MIIDTSYVLDLLTEDQAAFEKGIELMDANTPLRVLAMTLVELFIGYGATGDDEDAQQAENAIMGAILSSRWMTSSREKPAGSPAKPGRSRWGRDWCDSTSSI